MLLTELLVMVEPLTKVTQSQGAFQVGRERSEGREGLCVVEGNEHVTQCGATYTCLRPMQVLTGRAASTQAQRSTLRLQALRWHYSFYWDTQLPGVSEEGGNLSAYLLS